jgi:MOSC domain-containing protein YiiM
MAVIDQIFIARAAALPMESLPSVVVTATGLEGDRYTNRKGSYSGQRHDFRDVTLISQDDIREANAMLTVPFTAAETRRNLVIAGKIALLDLVGREFAIGTVVLRGIEEAPPCRIPERLAKKPGFFKMYKNRAGLRATVLRAGRISTGDELIPLSSTESKTIAAVQQSESPTG